MCIIKLFKCIFCGREGKDESAQWDISKLNGRDAILKAMTKFKDNRVWVTKKARMEAEKRMNFNNNVSIVLINYYTFLVLVLSIISLKWELGNILTFVSVLISVALFGVSLYITLYGYKEKALSYKSCYIELTALESELEVLLLNEKISDEDLLNEYGSLLSRYDKIMDMDDNHADIDFISHLKNQKDKKYMGWMQFKYIFHCTVKYLSISLLYAFPIIGVAFYLLGWGNK
ncbi:SLATT domain-containing protein [Rummeliibacillus sp. G93]|uniref:SLATT domain-containing protein n=1 Tax=Rummeliibacillus sp. G93 TaxID=2939494 RepID=UPI00201C6F85|nr:SLATT domain-containing protein [Rummeliibacillus sp. G93]UQW96678.1 SLATT domain-containing protein [Rummeliibacillus sp. G93]